MMSKKGQMFLVGVVILLVGIIMLRNFVGVYFTTEEKRHQESFMIDKRIENIKNEYENIINIASIQRKFGNSINESLVEYLSNFSAYMKNEYKSNPKFKVLYLVIFVNNSKYSVLLGNFLDDNINASLNVTASIPSLYEFGIVNDSESRTADFTSTESNFTVTLSYRIKNSNITERVYADSNKIFSFFDLSLVGKDYMVRKKFLYNRTWC